MKKINYQHGLWAITAVSVLAFTMFSCKSYSKKHVSKNFSIEVTHPFEDTNWAFEKEVLDFSFDIEDTNTLFDISLVLLYDTAVVTLKDIPLSLTLSAPDGMKSFSTSQFLLDSQGNPDIKIVDGHAEATVVVYPARRFKVPGTHTLTVYRRAEKADNYGFLSLTAKVNVAKK